MDTTLGVMILPVLWRHIGILPNIKTRCRCIFCSTGRYITKLIHCQSYPLHLSLSVRSLQPCTVRRKLYIKKKHQNGGTRCACAYFWRRAHYFCSMEKNGGREECARDVYRTRGRMFCACAWAGRDCRGSWKSWVRAMVEGLEQLFLNMGETLVHKISRNWGGVLKRFCLKD